MSIYGEMSVTLLKPAKLWDDDDATVETVEGERVAGRHDVSWASWCWLCLSPPGAKGTILVRK